MDRGGHEPTPAEVVATLRPLAPAFRRAGVVLALENHDRLGSRTLAALVTELGTDWVGICLDTVNSLGALEGPEVVVEVLGPLAVNLHVKDFDVVRANASLGFDVRGRPVGGGRLDLDTLLPRLTRPGALTAVVELWTPRQASAEATVELERRWAEESVTHLQRRFGRPEAVTAHPTSTRSAAR